MARITSEEMKERLAVYFIMGSQNSERPAEDVLKEALDGGVTLFQFREKGSAALEGEEKEALARQLQRLCRTYGVPFIVNDDVELAIAIDADGVHVGQDDEDARRVREKIGDKILGVSAHNVEEARAAIEAGADYIGVGPIYPTRSKDDANEAQGPGILRHLREQGITIPIVAIGGITADNTRAVIEAGADGVSVISAIASAPEPKAAAAALATAVREANLR
ncbi:MULTISPECIES: thiamine phosphate synthase [Geobacillus]|jgi:thiamine-phosphate pyrophosphorylase|uniref:Thiamine-phosphate synthase n=2 Tax=Geobacillus thermodenitrificans TaxID=33940 RepID=THIE_GEOTN|nr:MULTISPECIES: thiamine phosphate synthase [Geobacillus]A4IN28.1 RecName: Full=Thiamine-phosphate synthase; Short=TP synthase; Short=TPS; AltName: Full=Thiamine-phosphate pyrophosphorylase; Short=TMP pyrophosphorylase; Short=TMP-PPase [Geobacillus thermodenitrificans NG80-2]ABO66732.1 Thiamin-phosphate pyrophosphorylase [Geobacillus thermodenitrificans NG80-2]ARA96909.1 thiamine-phosphate diphosphorylase [Geobacillus thermodenitrificans]ARP42489.1 Thiamine-phosphate synthase [Geobacillus ther